MNGIGFTTYRHGMVWHGMASNGIGFTTFLTLFISLRCLNMLIIKDVPLELPQDEKLGYATSNYPDSTLVCLFEPAAQLVAGASRAPGITVTRQ